MAPPEVDPRVRLRVMSRGADTISALLKRRKRIVAISQTDYLLTSDHPAVLFKPLDPTPLVRGVLPDDAELWFPLSPTVLLVYEMAGVTQDDCEPIALHQKWFQMPTDFKRFIAMKSSMRILF